MSNIALVLSVVPKKLRRELEVPLVHYYKNY
jgi:hypothetical protein